ncbi:Tubulin-specific chaperone D C-terminal [Penicillium capsulatum]|uniref:Tubulin-specific chaperone D C-terminal n=1 Tax=Penicillium capsulatum TaxID=69766 RepID=A0A9W9HQ37_9EURO|nr:Tubulin-specific chaperone D C-terminal [Penicillium capsulatum]KAJ6113150.1 Tubulin-specific chaperone D C-terminal [Penicillium capsulatum]
MDATDDRDLKLQRAAGDLLTEFSIKLPLLLWSSRKEAAPRTPRKWAPVPETEKLVNLLEPFQEWPQLLDPHLQSLLPPLVDAFLAYLIRHSNQYGSTARTSSHSGALYPLPKAICRLLYTFCKVRGAKVIIRFLNNEPKYLQSLLRAFIQWDATENSTQAQDFLDLDCRSLQWEERYVMLVWLSHLLLAPFDLCSLSSDDIPVPYDNLGQLGKLSAQTPKVAKSLLSLALHYINVPGKEREAATALLARLVLRGDMQALGLLSGLTKWAFDTIQPATIKDTEKPSIYTCIGNLTFIARLGGSGQLEDFAPLLREVFEKTLSLSQGRSEVSKTIQSSALARKIVVKILRNTTEMALSLNERGHHCLSDDQLSMILEEAIDHFLVALADKDTPVRFAASKALSVIALKLDLDMGAEVIEAVIGSLGENILFEKSDGSLMTPFEARKAGVSALKRNLSAVDAQRWQGLMLTLSHLLFRRAPPIHQLPHVLQSLFSGLDFEQRSSTGSSVGTGVRDAACFGVWALSRKYTTSELQALALKPILSFPGANELEVLQMLAVELVCSACVDPSGNIRRGASAALQELIGRHPNTITEGIPLVQVVDYHAISRRSRAMIDVANATASLDSTYWSPLLEALMDWRGIGSPDAESRRHAAKSIGSLSTQKSFKTLKVVLQKLLLKLSRIPRGDVESRHGCLLSIAATVDAYIEEWGRSPESRDTPEAHTVLTQIAELWDVFQSPSGPSDNDLTLQSSRPELTAEASSCLLSSLCRSVILIRLSPPSEESLDRALRILSLSVSRSDDVSIEASSGALSTLFPLLSSSKQEEVLRKWFSHLQTSWRLPSGRGQILALGAVFKQIASRDVLREGVMTELLRSTRKEELIEKRVAAVKCFATQVLPHTDVATNVTHIFDFLNDYTTDRRGDIGSLIRVEAIQAVKTYLSHSPAASRSPIGMKLLGCLFRLASEKLDRVRLQAWLCLQDCWKLTHLEPLQRRFEHLSDVSSCEYFTQLLGQWSEEWLRLPLLQGLATSGVAGAESLIRSSRAALIQFFNSHDLETRQQILITFLQVLSNALSDNLQDDRYAIPIIDLVAFLIDNFAMPSSDELDPIFRETFTLVQRAHFRSSNIIRLEAAIRFYGALSSLEPLRQDVFKKLSGMLLHPFPRVRTCAAEYLFTATDSETVKYEDWSVKPKQLKGKVEALRGDLLLAQ